MGLKTADMNLFLLRTGIYSLTRVIFNEKGYLEAVYKSMLPTSFVDLSDSCNCLLYQQGRRRVAQGYVLLDEESRFSKVHETSSLSLAG